MSDFEKELEMMSQDVNADEPEVKLPSIEDQKAVVAELKKLEAEGKLTPEVLEEYFGQFYAKSDRTVH
ncbi:MULTISPECIES: restriction endonuclease subunit S [Vibrio]|uniref:Restriction endonuclease subunit S n=2 Tax=Vibrio TaxID=662 RepID=A0A7X4LLR7_9VIBR|nr:MULTISPECIES: restriction endonuclease subunit S [Vibrio]MBF9002057.1 restriction endonuclease subunit S [Vibrio nitrifigilis]MZI94002.1 restriction endonuclease subunit S [Vibrio eleionomae]